MIVQGLSSIYPLYQIGPIPCCSYKFSNPQQVNPGIFLGVGILYQRQLSFRANARYLGQIHKVGNALAIAFQVEARVLEVLRYINYRVANILSLILCRHLRELS